jgi:2-C-methyl-D-erythritol 4-phosphate cytidylyltransferase
MTCGAVIPAAGQGRRFGDGDKTLQIVAGRPVLAWSIRALIDSGEVSQVVVVVSESNQFQVIDLITGLHSPVPVTTVRGGELRMESVQAGVQALDDSCELVAIHDAARPVVSADLVRATIQAGRESGAAIPGTRVTDTIKRVADDMVVSTVDRSELVAVQTPQVFRRDWLIAAYHALDAETEATDEAAILEVADYPVRVVPGEPTNIKVTTKSDVLVADAFLRAKVSA